MLAPPEIEVSSFSSTRDSADGIRGSPGFLFITAGLDLGLFGIYFTVTKSLAAYEFALISLVS
jgi:hypothetical protein